MILSLFFTRGVSLETWINQGLFDREKLIYEEHLKQGNLDKVYWLTYGSKDKVLADKLKKENRLHKDIEVLQMPIFFNIPKIGSYLYSLFLPFIYKKELKNSDILKTNQMDGSISGVISRWLYKIKFINRTGYTLSIFTKKQNASKFKQYFIELNEKITYKYADVNIVASNQDKNYLINKYNLDGKTIEVIHNYIDTNLFKPLNLQREDKLVFVGRLNKQKNLFNLIESVSKTNLELDIYGKGELKEELINFTKELKAKVNFKGVVDNKELPYILNQYKYYILVSHYEGMPKTLLETMACGCICIGTDVDGINEVIEDKVNGYLAKEVNVSDILSILNKIDFIDNSKVSKNGIDTINNHFSLNTIVIRERDLFVK